jgi:alpha-beta hydrolase superfamily lysophospholipase
MAESSNPPETLEVGPPHRKLSTGELHNLPVIERWLTASDGVRLFLRDYQPAPGVASRTLLWCHGVCEHGGRYEHAIAEFLARGWRVIIPDLRGHGRSEGIRVDVTSFDVYLKDFNQIAQEFSLEPARTALFGHSMGGLVMTRWVQAQPRNWAALVLSAPLLGIAVPIPLWKWWLGQFLARIAPRTHLRTGISEKNMTGDVEFLQRRMADDLIQRSVTVRWFFAMLAALKRARLNARKVTLPVLILQGMADRTTDPKIPAIWLRNTRSSDSRLIEYPRGLHEVLNDADWRSVCAEILDWLELRIPIVG